MTAIADELRGKILVDCTNPVGPNLSHGLNNAQSGSAMVQALVPDAKVVKAFTIYGFENFEDSAYPAYDVRPVMMYCGEDAAGKAIVGGLIRQLGWEPLDVGGLNQALHLEHMTLLWVRMVRVDGHSPNMVGIRLPFLKNTEGDSFEGSVRTWVDSLVDYPSRNMQRLALLECHLPLSCDIQG